MPIFHRHDNKTHDLSTRFSYAALQVKNEFLDLVVTELSELLLSVAIWTNRSTIIVAPQTISTAMIMPLMVAFQRSG
jgi:hypothetical protein